MERRGSLNDNKAPPQAELLKQKVLSHAASIETHMTTGLNALLMRSGVSQQFAETMTGFVRPVLELVKGIESAVVGHAQKERITDLADASIHDSQTRSLEAWGTFSCNRLSRHSR